LPSDERKGLDSLSVVAGSIGMRFGGGMEESDRPAWAKAVTILRLIRRWKQTKLAAVAGVSVSAVSRYEKGERSLEPEKARRLVTAMGFPAYLWERTLAFVVATEAARASGPVAPESNIPSQITALASAAGRWAEVLVSEALTEALAATPRQATMSAERHGEGARHPPPWGESISILKVVRGWERKELAEAVGRPEETLANYESGKTVPKQAVLQELVTAMGFPCTALESAMALVHSARGALRRLARTSSDTLVEEIAAIAAEKAQRIEAYTQGEVGDLASAVRLLVSRGMARDLWAALDACPATGRAALVRELGDFQTPGFCELLCGESLKAAGDSARRAKQLAELAVLAAEQACGSEGLRSRLRGFAGAHLANALRVGGQGLPAADTVLEEALAMWRSGAGADAGLVNAARVLSLQASMRRDQRRFGEALAALDEGLQIDRWGETPALLLGKAVTLSELGEFKASIDQLCLAGTFVESETEPRRLYVIEGLWVFNLCRLGRYREAAERLPPLRKLARGNRLDRLRAEWQTGTVAAGLGRQQEALTVLRRVRDEFVALRNAYSAALVTLELAEMEAASGKIDAVQELARESAPIFVDQRLPREAQRALALFRQAAEKDRVTGELLRDLIDYLRRARRDPQLRFAATAG
jgi:transcriptional regulator with XRE-family HTH domain